MYFTCLIFDHKIINCGGTFNNCLVEPPHQKPNFKLNKNSKKIEPIALHLQLQKTFSLPLLVVHIHTHMPPFKEVSIEK
jgi:hypothetical protein